MKKKDQTHLKLKFAKSTIVKLNVLHQKQIVGGGVIPSLMCWSTGTGGVNGDETNCTIGGTATQTISDFQ